MKLVWFFAILVAFAVVTAFLSCSRGPQPPEPDLRGKWNLAMPSGFKKKAEIEYIGRQRYLIALKSNLGGIYEIMEDRLKKLNPGKDERRHYIWVIEDKDNLLLIESPPVSKVGCDYRGSVLSR